MKLNRNLIPVAAAVTALLITTSCSSHRTTPVTKLPQPSVTTVPSQPQPENFDTKPLSPPDNAPSVTSTTNNPVGSDGHIPTADIDLRNYNQDSGALAAYTVHFKFDSAAVQDREQANLASVAQALADQQLKLLINGYCDERGTEEYNRSLGERRALSLREALQKLNVDPMRVKTVSYGKDQPADPGHDEAAWARNRRGEFVLLRPKNLAP